MIGPSIPKELRDQRRKEKELRSKDEEESDLDDFIGPVLIHTDSPQETAGTTTQAKPLSLLELHQQGLQSKPTTYDSERALNDEVKQELLKKLSNVQGKFAPGTN